eukprot:TRINITY_DN31839_c0_g1_i1.p1 TRINITY_DN31839_c0_g1~~TRINITY_DN31839_c0_g1_i1.p1  ORF type:complete len:203 (+),score=82.55 TRINITY_DN31839_c0_g1_i1:55-609(+)
MEYLSYMLGVSSETDEVRSLGSGSTFPSSECLHDTASQSCDESDFAERLQQLAENPHLFRKGSGHSLEWTPLRVEHAKYVLSVCPALDKLRFGLCPKVLTEDEFWTTYFRLFEPLLDDNLHVDVPHVDIASPTPARAVTAKWSFYSDDDEADVCDILSREWFCTNCSYHNGPTEETCGMCSETR